MSFKLIACALGLTTSPAFAQEVVELGNDRGLLVGHPFFYMGTENQFTAGANIADFDGDGDMDVAFVNGRHWSQADELYFNRGDGRLLESVEIGTRRSTGYGGCSGDFDGDGSIDLLIPRDALPPIVYFSSDDDVLTDEVTLNRTADARGCAVADFTGDGVTDAVIGQRGDITFLMIGPLGSDSEARDILDGPVVGVAQADMNGDALPDLILSMRGTATGAVLMNEGEGNFAELLYFGDAESPSRAAAIGDWNGDGQPDIVAAVIRGPSTIYLNSGGEFTSKIELPEMGAVQTVELADLNDDGRLDAIFGADGENSIVMNTLPEPTLITIPDEDEADSYDVAIGDLSGNGFPDIVFANSGAPNLVIYNISTVED